MFGDPSSKARGQETLGAIVSGDRSGLLTLSAAPEAAELGDTLPGSDDSNLASEWRESLLAPESALAGGWDLPDDEDEMSVSVIATAGVER
jgi:hypothetical protein